MRLLLAALGCRSASLHLTIDAGAESRAGEDGLSALSPVPALLTCHVHVCICIYTYIYIHIGACMCIYWYACAHDERDDGHAWPAKPSKLPRLLSSSQKREVSHECTSLQLMRADAARVSGDFQSSSYLHPHDPQAFRSRLHRPQRGAPRVLDPVPRWLQPPCLGGLQQD